MTIIKCDQCGKEILIAGKAILVRVPWKFEAAEFCCIECAIKWLETQKKGCK